MRDIDITILMKIRKNTGTATQISSQNKRKFIEEKNKRMKHGAINNYTNNISNLFFCFFHSGIIPSNRP